MVIKNLIDLLEVAADSPVPRGIISYPLGDIENGRIMKYSELRFHAQCNAQRLSSITGFSKQSIFLLHFNNHLDNIIWFWSVVYSGCVPAISTPFVNDLEQRRKHFFHLHNILRDPICITRKELVAEFAGQNILKLYSTEGLGSMSNGSLNLETPHAPIVPQPADLALLMLTSGSTGNAKAVCLSHGQILASLAGKISVKILLPDRPFLNWIGLDHVAHMTEIHLQALSLKVDQIHVQTADIISDPLAFLRLASKHRVARAFAPNFFLAKLRRAMEVQDADSIEDLDLSSLWWMGSGGEANTVETCDALSKVFSKYNAPRNSIVPGFGMTEICAGAIYHLDCPRYDLQNQQEFTTLGTCMRGIEMRVTVPSENGRLAHPHELGNLEVTGPVVFKGYFNDLPATASAFTSDGWFKTGDRALLDSAGNLNLAGRLNDTITINGMKHQPFELEAALDEASNSIPGAIPSYNVCFSYRPSGSQTEQICVIYAPTYNPENTEARIRTLETIVQILMLQTSTRPYVLPLDRSFLQKSTLGKLSRTKIRMAFERGEYKTHQKSNDEIIKTHRVSNRMKPANKAECALLKLFLETLDILDESFGVETRIFEIGVTSIDLIRLKSQVEKRLLSSNELPMIILITNPTVRSLATALQDRQATTAGAYNPMVTLQHRGYNLPLWLIHPGVGEILVFLGLSKLMTDRPVYALRARGFDHGETYFESVDETVITYYAAMKAQQPTGPYALAGYSYGSMLAFEIAKMLEANGDKVRFCGSFNLPPHIKTRMRQLGWTECLLNLAYFLDLITEQRVHDIATEMQERSKEQMVDHIVEIALPNRMAELALSSKALINWANLAFALQSMARDYEPSGSVEVMDVFCATPLAAVAKSKEQWLVDHLGAWKNFCRTGLAVWEVDGAHYTMLGPDHVDSFQTTLKQALEARGL